MEKITPEDLTSMFQDQWLVHEITEVNVTDDSLEFDLVVTFLNDTKGKEPILWDITKHEFEEKRVCINAK